jgi:hypothetical protein
MGVLTSERLSELLVGDSVLERSRGSPVEILVLARSLAMADTVGCDCDAPARVLSFLSGVEQRQCNGSRDLRVSRVD